jgi:hypothetical protein
MTMKRMGEVCENVRRAARRAWWWELRKRDQALPSLSAPLSPLPFTCSAAASSASWVGKPVRSVLPSVPRASGSKGESGQAAKTAPVSAGGNVKAAAGSVSSFSTPSPSTLRAETEALRAPATHRASTDAPGLTQSTYPELAAADGGGWTTAAPPQVVEEVEVSLLPSSLLAHRARGGATSARTAPAATSRRMESRRRAGRRRRGVMVGCQGVRR